MLKFHLISWDSEKKKQVKNIVVNALAYWNWCFVKLTQIPFMKQQEGAHMKEKNPLKNK